MKATLIQLTKDAEQKLLDLRVKEGYDAQHALRVSVRSGGCSGLLYDLSFDKEQHPEDKVCEITQQFRIVVDKKSLFYLVGTTLDFSEGLNGKGFHFVNPNAKRTCGCGESFSL